MAGRDRAATGRAEFACVAVDKFRHAEFTEAMQAAGLGRVPFIWRGFGSKDGFEDIERFRRALFDGQVKVTPSLLLRFAFADAITLVDPANNHKLARARSLGRVDAAAAPALAIAEGAPRKAAPTARRGWHGHGLAASQQARHRHQTLAGAAASDPRTGRLGLCGLRPDPRTP